MPKCVVLYSGGEGSLATALVCAELYSHHEKILYFNDTKTEDPDLYRYLEETVKVLTEEYGYSFLEDSDGRDVWQVQKDAKFLANNRRDTCSQNLKRKRSQKWTKNHLTQSDIVAIGIDWSEVHRYEKALKNWEYVTFIAPLCDLNEDYTPKNNKRAILDSFYQKYQIERPRLYSLGFAHNNCGGFCVKAGLGQFKLLWEKLPNVYLYHENQQEEAFKVVGRYPFLSKTVNKTRYYISMQEYREFLQTGKLYSEGKLIYTGNLTEEETQEYGGCGCAI